MVDFIYSDTNPYIDAYQGRKGKRPFRNQSEEGHTMFNSIERGDFGIVTSDHLEKQLKGNLSPDELALYKAFIQKIASLGNHCHVISDKKDKEQARKLAQENHTSYDDALHFVLAKKGGAKFLATQNDPDFACFSKEIIVCGPSMAVSGLLG